MPFPRGTTKFFLYCKAKKGTKTKHKKQKINKFGGFRAKWGGPLGHLTWPLNPPKQKRNNNKKKQRKQKQIKKKKKQKKQRTKKQRNYKNTKKLFSYQSIFLVGVQNFPFWQLGPKSAHPKNTIKNVRKFVWECGRDQFWNHKFTILMAFSRPQNCFG